MRLTKRLAGAPEDSVRLRLVAASAIMVSIGAVVAQGVVPVYTAIGALALAPLGYWFSHRHRHRANIGTKIVLAIGLFVAFAAFLQSVGSARSVDDARGPLAALFLWVQVLHSFDVPRRRDLAFSMVSSVILMAEAGSLSISIAFGSFLIPWAALSALWMYVSSRPPAGSLDQPRRVSTTTGRTGVLSKTRSVGGTGLAVAIASASVFLLLPRLPGSVVRTPPFALRRAAEVANFAGGVSNPGLPAKDGNGVVNYSPNAYPGFGSSIDLRARGALSDSVVMRVRSPQAALWRGQSYDRFDGTVWTASSSRTFPLPTIGDGQYGVSGTDWRGPTQHVIQTFYVAEPEPNILFSAANVSSLYFPSGGLKIDEFGSIRAPIFLDPGMVYSVVSEIPDPTSLDLRSVPSVKPGHESAYLELPSDLPARDVTLARSITAGINDQYDRVQAVQSWIRANTTYNLNVPPPTQGRDAVDSFLFGSRQGFCEQIASAMAILLRADGIPTRLVTGFAPGKRDPLTGYYEVRESDAHAWVEVFYRGLGWLPYDPTFGVPAASVSLLSRFPAAAVIGAIARWISDHVPFGAIGSALASVRRAVASVVSAAPWAAVIAVGAATLGAWFWRRRRRRRSGEPPVAGAAAAFVDLSRTLEAHGLLRDPAWTPSEFLDEVDEAGLGSRLTDAAGVVIRTFEEEMFSGSRVADAELSRARAAAREAREILSSGSR